MPIKLKNQIDQAIEQALAPLPTEEDFIARDRRTCDCELTYVFRKRHAALGTGIEVRLCCLAKKVEQLAGLPDGTFFAAFDFQPTWEWDCNEIHTIEQKKSDGSRNILERKLGPPPKWLMKRLKQKGITVKNL